MKPPRATPLRFHIPTGLYEATAEAAYEAEQTMSRYGKSAILLLGFATFQGFNTTDTKLMVDNTPVDIPHLATPDAELTGPQRELKVYGVPEADALQFAGYAQLANISENERFSRALRFRNFVLKHSIDHRHQFRHRDKLLRLVY